MILLEIFGWAVLIFFGVPTMVFFCAKQWAYGILCGKELFKKFMKYEQQGELDEQKEQTKEGGTGVNGQEESRRP